MKLKSLIHFSLVETERERLQERDHEIERSKTN